MRGFDMMSRMSPIDDEISAAIAAPADELAAAERGVA